MINSPINKQTILLVSLGLVFGPCTTHANTDNEKQQQEALPSISVLTPLDKPRDVISNQVVRFADWIDTFFAGDRAYDELQDSHVKIYILQTHFEHDKPVYETTLKAKLTLPRTQKRLKLLIESEEDEDNEDDEDAVTDIGQQDSIVEATEETSQSIGLRFIQKETKLWRIHTDALLRYRSGIEPVVRLRLRRRVVRDSWIYRISENITWDSTDGLQETTRLTIDHTLAEKWLFRSSTHATWKNINGYFNYGQDFLLYQNISKRKALTYQTGIRAITQDKPHTTNYFLSLRYREQIHRGWLFYEIIPVINHPEEEDFKPVRSISLKLEAVFGRN